MKKSATFFWFFFISVFLLFCGVWWVINYLLQKFENLL